MPKSTFTQTNFTAGEISPKALGRFDLSKFTNAVKKMENFLNYQLGGGLYRPGTRMVVACKSSSDSARLLTFQYSTDQNYAVEMGNLYMRFCANGAQVVVGGNAVEIGSPYAGTQVYEVMYTQNADTMYTVHGSVHPYKLQRTSSTSFTMALVPFVRGPFRDDNVTATTITPSSATSNTNLLASAAIFQSTHVGSLWRVKDGVVKIVSYVSPSGVTGAVQTEPDGTAGNLGGTAAVTDWAEGAFSAYRGYPEAVCFHEGRLYYGMGQTFYGSTIGAYDDFSKGTAADDEAPTFELNTDQVNKIRWLSPSAKGLDIGTSGGTFPASGSAGLPITPSDISCPRATTYGAAKVRPARFSGYLYYLQRNLMNIRELSFSFDLDQQKTNDMNLLADHILRDGGGVIDMAYQQSPNERIWAVRNDGQIAILTRNVDQEVMGWTRIVAGNDARGAGKFESISIMPEDQDDDLIYVTVKRNINGVTKRYIEYFTPEFFTDNWDAVRLDSSLTLDSPKTITGATQADPIVITAVAHGFSDGDQVKIDGVEGMTELNGNFYVINNKTTDTFELTDLSGDYPVSNADIDDEDMADIIDWTDADNGTGAASTQVTFDSKSCMKLDSGNAAINNYAFRYQDLGTFGARTIFSLSLYCDAIGTIANTDAFELRAFDGTTQLWMHWASDGLFVFDGTANHEVGTDLVIQDTWQEWTIDVNWILQTVDIYLNGILKASGVDCSYAVAGTNGRVDFFQFGYTTANRITYIDWFKAGSSFDYYGANIDGTAFGEYHSGGEVRKMVTNITGLDHLNGETVSVVVDGGVPSGQQTFPVLGGSFNLLQKAAVVHAGLPYNGTIQMLKLSDGSPVGTGQTKKRRIYLSTVRVDKSLGMKIGRTEDALSKVYFRAPNDPLGEVAPYFTGDVEKFFDTGWGSEDEIIIRQDQPLPLCILAVVLRSETEER